MKNVARVLSHICGIGMLAAVGCGMYKAFNEMKAEEKRMPFAEFKQWWEETCKNAPNHIVKSADCHFGYADNSPVISSRKSCHAGGDYLPGIFECICRNRS